MRPLIAGSWLTISEGCDLSCTMQASDEANITLTNAGVDHELSFDYTTFKTLVEQATTALAEMEAAAAAEQAEWDNKNNT